MFNRISEITDTLAPTDIISNLPVRPEISAAKLQAQFDAGADGLKKAVNEMIDEMNANIDALNALVVQESGSAEDKVMSQKAVTDLVANTVIEAGAGDMQKSVYDADGDGVVDNASAIGGMDFESLKREIMLSMYPVGSVKMSTINQNPETYIGGEWIPWGAGRVPVGIDTENSFFNATEKTGGEAEVRLTQEQMAAHTHAFTGAAVTSGGQSVDHTHAIPALTGTAVSAGSHSHLTRYQACGSQQSGYGLTQAEAFKNNVGVYLGAVDAGTVTALSGAHTHTVATAASNTGNQSASHSHTVTAAGTNAVTGGGSAHSNLQPYIVCYMWKRTA